MSKKNLIIDKSIPLFIEHGIYKTSTAMILKETNLSNGGFFNYFKNKNDLVKASYIKCKIDMLNANYQDIADLIEPKAIIKTLFLTVVNWGLENPQKHLFMRQVTNEPFIREYNLNQNYNDYAHIIKKIQLAIDALEFYVWDTFSFLLNIYSLMDAIHDYLIANTDTNQEQYINFCFEQFYHGIQFNYYN